MVTGPGTAASGEAFLTGDRLDSPTAAAILRQRPDPAARLRSNLLKVLRDPAFGALGTARTLPRGPFVFTHPKLAVPHGGCVPVEEG